MNFDPSVGAEMRKIRPAAVLSADRIARLPLRIVVPLTDWKPQYIRYPWFVQISPDPSNGLTKESGAGAFEVKSVAESRFVQYLGSLSSRELDAIAAAVALVVDKP